MTNYILRVQFFDYILKENFIAGSPQRNDGLMAYTELQSAQNMLINRLILDITNGNNFSDGNYSGMENELNENYHKFSSYVKNTVENQEYYPKNGAVVIAIIGVLVTVGNHLYENWAKAEEAKKQEIIRMLEGLKLVVVK